MQPVSRSENILTTELPTGEIVVYDMKAAAYQHLTPTCAFVWRKCDGRTSLAELSAAVATAFELSDGASMAELAVAELRARNLLIQDPEDAATAGPEMVSQELSRRQALRRLVAQSVAVSLLPVVTSLTVPTRLHAHGGAQGSPLPTLRAFSPPSYSVPSNSQSKSSDSNGDGGVFSWWPWNRP